MQSTRTIGDLAKKGRRIQGKNLVKLIVKCEAQRLNVVDLIVIMWAKEMKTLSYWEVH